MKNTNAQSLFNRFVSAIRGVCRMNGAPEFCPTEKTCGPDTAEIAAQTGLPLYLTKWVDPNYLA